MDELEGENSDIVKLIAFDNSISLCEDAMLKAASLHKDFWGELREEQPDFAKLNFVGSKINYHVKEAKNQYNEMQRINPSMPVTIIVFSRFIKSILNDKEYSKKLVLIFTKMLHNKKEIKDENEFVAYDQENEFFESNLDIQRKAYIVVRATREEAGSIMRANLLFSALFGYSKEEILSKKINILMPELYAANHTDFLNRFLENTALDQFYESKYLNVNQNFYGKNKSGYIFPITSKVLFLKEQSIFITTFIPQLIVKNNMHFMMNKEGLILDISASVIHFLKLDLLQIRKNRTNISEYIPNILQEKDKYLNNGISVNLKVFLDNEEKICSFNCQVGSIDFFIIEQDFNGEDGMGNEEAKIQKNFGFWVKLEKNNLPLVPANLLTAVDKGDKTKKSYRGTIGINLNLGYKSGNNSPESKKFIF